MHKILLLEDEELIGENLQQILKREGYDVDWFQVGDHAVDAAVVNNYDLMILDVMLKVTSEATITNGLEVARIVQQVKKTPYILLTSRGESHDIMLGLDMGAEDYITKPYDLTVLLARIRNVLRRSSSKDDGILKCDGITLNLMTHKLTVDGKPISISNQLFEILHYLMKNKTKIVMKEELYRNIWGYDPSQSTETNTLEVNIKRLRQLIGSKYITTVRGKGYMLEEHTK